MSAPQSADKAMVTAGAVSITAEAVSVTEKPMEKCAMAEKPTEECAVAEEPMEKCTSITAGSGDALDAAVAAFVTAGAVSVTVDVVSIAADPKLYDQGEAVAEDDQEADAGNPQISHLSQAGAEGLQTSHQEPGKEDPVKPYSQGEGHDDKYHEDGAGQYAHSECGGPYDKCYGYSANLQSGGGYMAPVGMAKYDDLAMMEIYEAPAGENVSKQPAGTQDYKAPAGVPDHEAPAGGNVSKQPDVGEVSMRFAVGGVSKTITAEGGNSKKPARREKLHIMGVCAALMAYLVILWIRGDAGTAQQTKHGGLYEPWWGSATPGVLAMVENNTVVWGTGQIARVEQNMVDQSASFGWCTNDRGTDAEDDATSMKIYASQDMVGHGGQYHQQHQAGQRPHHHQEGGHGGHHQQEACHSHPQQQGGHSFLPRPAGHQPEQQAGRGHCQHLRNQHMLQAGRPPEGSSGFENKYDDIGLKNSFRNRYEQNTSVLDGGRASLVVRCRLQEERNTVYCRVTFRFSTWPEVHASTDTLVRQLPYLVRRSWEEVVPWGD
jgi:hypothetical protein